MKDAPVGSPTELGIKTIDYSLINIFSLGLYNFLNGSIYKQLSQLPETINQTTPISLSSLPVIGGFLNRITLGLGLG
jgi:hypothetical protein